MIIQQDTQISCISDLYYKIGRWFTIIMVAIAFLVLPIALNIEDSIFSFLMCAGIAFVGVAADYRDKTEHPIHYISACISGVCSIIWISIVNPWNLLFLLISLIGLIDKNRWLLWCETSCLVMILIQLMFNI